METASLVEATRAASGLTLAPDVASRALRYAELLLEASRTQNLVGHDSLEDVVALLVVDALAAAPCLAEPNLAVMDLGTGGGIPGLPLALACPASRFSLVDATLRKVQFIREVVLQLQVENVTAMAGRAEDLGRDPDYRETQDVVLAKAVAPMAVLVELAVPLLKPGGRLLAWKGPQVEQELGEAQGALAQLGAVVERKLPYGLRDAQGVAQERILVEVRRHGPLSDRFPRRAGMPAKKPLR